MPGVIIKIIIMGGGFSGQICIPLGGKVYQSSVTAPDKVRGSFFSLNAKRQRHVLLELQQRALPHHSRKVKMTSFSFIFPGLSRLTLATEL